MSGDAGVGSEKSFKLEEYQPQNLNFEGDYAYTKAGDLVNQVVVYDMKPLMQKEELHKYCTQRFGAVKTCEVVVEGNDSPLGFVVFDDPKNASAMLKSKICNDHDRTFSVGASVATCSTPPQMNILNLNVDCLLTIFDYLPIEDQIQCSRVSTHFREIFKMKFISKNKCFYDYKFLHLPWRDHQDVFELIGGSIEGVSITSMEKDLRREFLMDLVKKFCPNLRKIHLSGERIGFEFIDKVQNTALGIVEAHIIDHELNDGFVREFQRFRNLEILSIKMSQEITGACLDAFCSIQELCLRCCPAIQEKHFNNALKNMNNLRSLDIIGCFNLDNALEEIIKCNPKLEVLHMSTGKLDLKNISELKYLKELEVCVFGSYFVANLEVDDYNTGSNYESLCVNRDFEKCDKIFEENIHHIAKVKSLRKLNISTVQLNNHAMRELSKLTQIEDLNTTTASVLNFEGLLQFIKSCNELKLLNVPSVKFTENQLKNIIDLVTSLTKQGKRSHKLILKISNLSKENATRMLKHYKDPCISEIIEIKVEKIPKMFLIFRLSDNEP